MKGLFTCALIFAGPSLSQPVFSLKLENFEAWSNCCFFFFFFAQINVCFFPRQYFPIRPLLTAIICRYVLCSAMYFSLLFISACLSIYLFMMPFQVMYDSCFYPVWWFARCSPAFRVPWCMVASWAVCTPPYVTEVLSAISDDSYFSCVFFCVWWFFSSLLMFSWTQVQDVLYFKVPSKKDAHKR